jgi:hypothetical protein
VWQCQRQQLSGSAKLEGAAAPFLWHAFRLP